MGASGIFLRQKVGKDLTIKRLVTGIFIVFKSILFIPIYIKEF